MLNQATKNIIGTRGFFYDVGFLASILLPIKTAILRLEGASVNLADCFIELIKLFVSINNIPNEQGMIGFKNHCIKVINDRWESFDIKPYLLTYFLHPLYRGKYNLNKSLKTKKSINLIIFTFRCRFKIIYVV